MMQSQKKQRRRRRRRRKKVIMGLTMRLALTALGRTGDPR
jgi:hypothetical protein